jgi:flagellar hook-length control protein FliK
MTLVANNQLDGKATLISSSAKKQTETKGETGFGNLLEEMQAVILQSITMLPIESKASSDINQGKDSGQLAQNQQPFQGNTMMNTSLILKRESKEQIPVQSMSGTEKKQNKLDFIKPNLSFKEFLPSDKAPEKEPDLSDGVKLEQTISRSSSSSDPQTTAASPVMSKTEQYVLHIGKSDTTGNEGKFIRDFQQLLGRSSFIQDGQSSKMMIKLFPEHLGALKIEIIKNEHGMTAKLIASTQQAKELLESQLSSLKQAFTNQQIHVERIEIQQQFQPFEKFMNQGFQQHDETGRERNEQQSTEKEQEEEENSFSTTFEEALFNFNV